MKFMPINRQMYNVISEKEYFRRSTLNPELTKEISSDIAVEKDGYVYPVLPQTASECMVGIIDYDIAVKYHKPQNEEQVETYSTKHLIDFDKVDSAREMIQKQAEFEAAERTVLISKDNIYSLSIDTEKDSPEFALLKDAINKKQVDIQAYRGKLGSDFSNDLRLLTSSNSITFNKMKEIGGALDISGELILRDKNPNVANPIGEEIRTIIF